jgi:hypothetical protein
MVTKQQFRKIQQDMEAALDQNCIRRVHEWSEVDFYSKPSSYSAELGNTAKAVVDAVMQKHGFCRDAAVEITFKGKKATVEAGRQALKNVMHEGRKIYVATESECDGKRVIIRCKHGSDKELKSMVGTFVSDLRRQLTNSRNGIHRDKRRKTTKDQWRDIIRVSGVDCCDAAKNAEIEDVIVHPPCKGTMQRIDLCVCLEVAATEELGDILCMILRSYINRKVSAQKENKQPFPFALSNDVKLPRVEHARAIKGVHN